MLEHWRAQFERLGLGELWAELARPGSPFAFLLAQGLRVAQPTLGVFAAASTLETISQLADQLEGTPSHEQ